MRQTYFLSIMLLLGLCTNLQAQSGNEKPNIVWLVTEDNAWHYLKLYNEHGVAMPNVERLANNGVVFNNAFSNAPVCSVARSTIISGCYAPRIGAQYHRRMQLAPMPDGLEMFPYYLRQAGYYTTNNSKEDYNLVKSENVWDESSGEATYQNRKAGQPFFHVQNFGITHEGQLHFSAEKMAQEETNNSQSDVELFEYLPDTPLGKYTYAKYLDLHQKADMAIGEFIDQLESEGLLENTFIFYYGDHGGVLPRSKGYIYESGLHVPFVVYVPEKWKNLVPIEKGKRSDAFIQFIDLGPTVLNLAGVNTPNGMDGSPFLGKGVTKSDLKKKDSAFGYADRFDEKYDLARSIRKGKYKYIRNYQPFNIDGLFNFYRYKMLAYKEWKELFDGGKLNDAQKQFFLPRSPEALYDLEQDPNETKNLVKDPEYQKVLIELRKELQEHEKVMPDLSFYPEPYFLAGGIDNPVNFGQKNKGDISALIDVADLSLLTFEEAKKSIETALTSDNPWKRYWALIVCSSFGKDAIEFTSKAKEILESDEENLVKVRAAEFLALNTNQDVSNELLTCIKNAKTESEANLILNTVTLLKEQCKDFSIKIPREYFKESWLQGNGTVVGRRVDYINE